MTNNRKKKLVSKYKKLLLIILLCIFHNHFAVAQASSSDRPNIIFIMSDDHTAQAIGTYATTLKDVAVTPNIDSFSEQGAKLTRVFATNSICTPSRASILTGQYSHVNQVYTLSDSLNPGLETVATILQENGYQTALFGKWHLKTKPSGFGTYNILPGQGRYHNPILRNSDNWEEGGEEYEGFSTDVVTDQTLDWLERRRKDQPFMLFTHFKASHESFNYAERFDTLYQQTTIPEPESLLNFYPVQTTRSFSGQVLEILGGRFVQRPESYMLDEFSLEGLNPLEKRRKIYQAFVKSFLRSGATIDENVGRILDYVENNNLADNTVIIYTSDQGYFLGEHGMFDKRMMHEQSMQMPFIIRYPKEIPSGSTVDDIILNTDFTPLLLDYAGLQKPESMQGRSFRANLQNETPNDWRDSMYYRYWMQESNRPAHMGVRTKRYKLIFLNGRDLRPSNSGWASPTLGVESEPAWEFYDLQKDPHELHNVYYDEEYQDEINRLREELYRLRSEVGDTLNDQNDEDMIKVLDENFNL